MDKQAKADARQEGYVAGLATAKKILDTLSRSEVSEVAAVLGVLIDALKIES